MTTRYNVLLYSHRTKEIDAYELLVRAANLPIDLFVCHTTEEAIAAMPETDIVFGIHLPQEVYAHANTRLKWIQSMWAGVEKLLTTSLPEHVIITKPFGVFGQYISQYIFGFLLAHNVHLTTFIEQQQRQEWKPFYIKPIRGSRIGIAGMGDIGNEVARVAKSFEMETWALNQIAKPHPYIDRAFGLDNILAFAAGVDILALILPNTKDTKHLINKAVIDKMKPDALIINAGRGTVIDDEALIDALKAGRIGGAVLDVFVTEPLPTDHAYWKLPNCIVTPHIGGPSLPEDITHCFITNFKRFINGEELLARIDRKKGY